jgi:hypothetical protein
MPKRTAKFVSAVFVNILAGIPLATMGHGETATADNCLSEPKAETPPGSHWRYRIDHANKRNCWYLRAEGGGLAQAAPQNTPQVPSPPSHAKPSVTDAHAELRARTSREDSPAVGPPANTPAASPAWPAIPSPATATAAVATRWPEPAATNSASSGGSGTANPSGNPPAAADLPKASAASAIADSSPPAQPVRIPALIAAAVGALAFAGAAAKLISRRSRARRPRHRKMVHGRAPIWETTDDDRIFLSDHPPSGNRDYRPRFARSAGSAKVQSTRVQGDRKTEFVPRTPRRAPR